MSNRDNKTTPDKGRPLSALKNIGETVQKRLNEIGIYDEDDLRRVGPAAAYQRMKTLHPRLPVCYYLYSLEGALRDLHWNEIGNGRKAALKESLKTC